LLQQAIRNVRLNGRITRTRGVARSCYGVGFTETFTPKPKPELSLQR
jgi:hypothetical protein